MVVSDRGKRVYNDDAKGMLMLMLIVQHLTSKKQKNFQRQQDLPSNTLI